MKHQINTKTNNSNEIVLVTASENTIKNL